MLRNRNRNGDGVITEGKLLSELSGCLRDSKQYRAHVSVFVREFQKNTQHKDALNLDTHTQRPKSKLETLVTQRTPSRRQRLQKELFLHKLRDLQLIPTVPSKPFLPHPTRAYFN